MRCVGSGAQPTQRGNAPTSSFTRPTSTTLDGRMPLLSPAKLLRHRRRACAARGERAYRDDPRRRDESPLRATEPPLDRAEHAGGGQDRHAMRLRHRAAEVLRQTQRAPQHANVGGDRRGQRAEPTDFGQIHVIAERDDEERIRDAIRNLVVERTGGRLTLPFDRHHAVEKVAQQPQLHAGRSHEQPGNGGQEIERRRATGGEHRADHRYGIGSDARPNQHTGEKTRPSGGAGGEGTSVRSFLLFWGGHRIRRQSAEYTTSPPITVSTTLAFRICGSGIVMRSAENTEKSACLPTSILPRSFSWKAA